MKFKNEIYLVAKTVTSSTMYGQPFYCVPERTEKSKKNP